MFTESMIDDMNLTEIQDTIKVFAKKLDVEFIDCHDTVDYCKALILLSENMRSRVQDYIDANT